VSCHAALKRSKRRTSPFDNPAHVEEHTLLTRVGNPGSVAADQQTMNPPREIPNSSGGTTVRLEACIERLGAGDMTARDDLIVFACERMQGMASRMLRRFPKVRRWDETGDIVQNAAIRLYKTLGSITPRSPRGFLGLAAVHIRRELLDLARKHAGPESYAANHDTNYQRHDGQEWARVDEAADDRAESLDQMARWARLHESAERLPEEERELFHLVWYLGTKQEEAARMLDCSVRTVKRRWESVKRLLAESLEGEQPA
jgi:RNA polymerase sigma factor (sigma-70 family)